MQKIRLFCHFDLEILQSDWLRAFWQTRYISGTRFFPDMRLV